MEPDRSWELTRWGRIDQARRELAAVLGKDVSVEKLAELVGLSGPSLQGWKQGSRPKEASIEALERILVGAGLTRYTRQYIDYGSQAVAAEAQYRDGLQQATAEGEAEDAAETAVISEQGVSRAAGERKARREESRTVPRGRKPPAGKRKRA